MQSLLVLSIWVYIVNIFLKYAQYSLFQHKLAMHVKIGYDSEHASNKVLLNQKYGISLPLINKRKSAPVSSLNYFNALYQYYHDTSKAERFLCLKYGFK